MAHPLIPQILEVAAPIAESIELEVVHAVFQTNQNPPVLRIDVRNKQEETGLEDCERMSRALEPLLNELIPDQYVLEVSSPGIPKSLTSDREFISFRGFPTLVTTSEPHQGHIYWEGSLIRRDETNVYISKRGRTITIPRAIVASVQLTESED
jgi:ribosome maturation factor RimP